MAYVIAEPCIDNMDQSCVAVCPVDCIASDPSADRKFYIDPDNCIDCGACEQACPNKAIFQADRLPAEWAGFGWGLDTCLEPYLSQPIWLYPPEKNIPLSTLLLPLLLVCEGHLSILC